MLRRSSPRSLRAQAALAFGVSLLLSGCPDPQPVSPGPAVDDVAPPAVRPPAPIPPAPPEKVIAPQPAPKDAREAWERAATRQETWRVGIAKALKPEAERAALLAPFEAPSDDLRRLLALTRALPSLAPQLGHPASLRYRLERLFKEESFLAATPLTPESDAACGLLLLADARLLLRERFLLTDAGWQSPRQGLSDGSFPEARAQALLEAVELARDSRWPEATPRLSAALRAEAAATTKASGLAGAQAAWAELEQGWGSLSLDDFEAALQRWSAALTRKGVTGPAAKAKKG